MRALSSASRKVWCGYVHTSVRWSPSSCTQGGPVQGALVGNLLAYKAYQAELGEGKETLGTVGEKQHTCMGESFLAHQIRVKGSNRSLWSWLGQCTQGGNTVPRMRFSPRGALS
jgi:hypothetical protein